MKSDIKILLSNVTLNTAIILMAALGIIARLYIAKNGIGFYSDDYVLLKSAADFSLIDIFTKPLEYDQSCAPLYVIILKFLYNNFGLNHHAIGGGSLLFSCLALVLMPIAIFKISKSRFAAFMSVSIMSFNSYILHFTQRLKQYSSDIFITILLIYLGYIFFATPVTKKKMIFFTVICIICGLFSHSSILLIACLIFYYLFLFEKDDTKTKIINFIIFIIPWLSIFIPYYFLVCTQNINCSGLVDFWTQEHFYIQNFQHFREFICYLFGNPEGYGFLPDLTFNHYFWFLFIPILIGAALILINKDKYLFSILILPLITAQIIGIMQIYPFTDERVCLYLCPIALILFLLPIKYIKINNKISRCLLSVLIVCYYLFIFDKASILSIKNFFNGYNYEQNTINMYIEELYKSDIKTDDIIYLSGDDDAWQLFEVFDKKGVFKENIQIKDWDCPECEGSIYEDINKEQHYLTNLKNIDNNINIYFYLYKDDALLQLFNFEEAYKKVKENTNIIYEYETWNGDKFIKARKK